MERALPCPWKGTVTLLGSLEKPAYGDMRVARNNTPSTTVALEFAQKIKQQYRRDKITQLSAVLILLCLVVFFSVASPGFFSLSNLLTILGQIAIPLVLSLGLTFVVLTGSIDLSIDGTMGLAGTVVGFLVANNQNTWHLGALGILLAVAIGGVSGLLIGTIYVKARIPSFMVSFGMSSIMGGIAESINGTLPATITDKAFRSLALDQFLGIPFITWLALAVFLLAYVIQERTAFGRHLYAIGANENIPKMSGIDVDAVKIGAFVWAGLCIGLAGVIGAARLGLGTILIGRNNLFPTLTAVVVGGTLFSGGKGGVLNTLFGVLIVTVLNDGLILWGVQPELQRGIQGLIIVSTVAASVARSRKLISK